MLIEAAQSRGETLDHVIFSGPPAWARPRWPPLSPTSWALRSRPRPVPPSRAPGDLAGHPHQPAAGTMLFIDDPPPQPFGRGGPVLPAMEDFALDIVIGKGPAARLDPPSISRKVSRWWAATTRSRHVDRAAARPLRHFFARTTTRSRNSRRFVERSAGILGVTIDRACACEIGSRSARHAASREPTAQARARLRPGARRRRDRFGHRREAMAFFEIDELGLDWMDIRILETLCKTFRGRAVGLSTPRQRGGGGPQHARGRVRALSPAARLIIRTPQGRMGTAARSSTWGWSRTGNSAPASRAARLPVQRLARRPPTIAARRAVRSWPFARCRSPVRPCYWTGYSSKRRDHDTMMTDIEIAHSVTPLPIAEVAEAPGRYEANLIPYGFDKAKVDYSLLNEEDNHKAKLVLVTARINPTPAGEGKTTTTIGLADGPPPRDQERRGCASLPRPRVWRQGRCRWRRLGPGRPDGGHQPALHRRLPRHRRCEQPAGRHARQPYPAGQRALGIDVKRITWKRVVDMNDRQLRHVIDGIGGKAQGVPREDGFDITVASEVMAIPCLRLPSTTSRRAWAISSSAIYAGEPPSVPACSRRRAPWLRS